MTKKKAPGTAKKPRLGVEPCRPEKPLTVQQERFARNVAAGQMRNSDAYRDAYPNNKSIPNTIARRANELLRRPNVARRVKELAKEYADKAELDAVAFLREAQRIALFDPRKLFDNEGMPKPIHELDDGTAAAIAGLEVVQMGGDDGPSIVKKYKIADKNAALEKMFKHYGLYEKDNRQQAAGVRDLLEEIAKRQAAAGIGAFPIAKTVPVDDDDNDDDS